MFPAFSFDACLARIWLRQRWSGVIPCRDSMFNGLRYYWITAKGYRLRPWTSPYLQWRLETFFGKEAANLNAAKFFSLMWRERARMERFLEWVAIRRKAQRH